MAPLLYKITFLSEVYPDRKPSVIVVAKDIPEAIETARRFAKSEAMGPAKVQNAELLIPRWAESNSMPPDCLSESAIQHFQKIASKFR